MDGGGRPGCGAPGGFPQAVFHRGLSTGLWTEGAVDNGGSGVRGSGVLPGDAGHRAPSGRRQGAVRAPGTSGTGWQGPSGRRQGPVRAPGEGSGYMTRAPGPEGRPGALERAGRDQALRRSQTSSAVASSPRSTRIRSYRSCSTSGRTYPSACSSIHRSHCSRVPTYSGSSESGRHPAEA